MRNIMLIARREFRVRALTKSTIIAVAIVMALLIGGGVAAGIFLGQGKQHATTVAVPGELHAVGQILAGTDADSTAAGNDDAGAAAGVKNIMPRFKVKEMGDASAKQLAKAVADGDVDYALSLKNNKLQLFSNGEPDIMVRSLFDSLAKQAVLSDALARADVDPAPVLQQIAAAGIAVQDVGHKDAIDSNLGGYVVAFVTCSLLFMLMMSAGQLIAMGVVEEKSSRVVEILLATVRPSELLVGKILGIMLLSLVQFVLYAVAGYIGITASGLLTEFPLDLGGFGFGSFVWLLLGLATYPILYAGLGALVDRQEEIGSMVLPLMLLQMLPFYAAIFGSQNDPNAPWFRVLSWLPFANCYLMPFRQASGEMALWEPLLAVLINLVFLPFAVWFGARLYRGGVMHMGGKLSLREALRRGGAAGSAAKQ